MLTGSYTEKRNYMRLEIEGDVICRVRGSDRSFTASAIDLSHTGLKFATTALLNDGMLLDVAVRVGSGSVSPLNAVFLVRRVQRDGDRYIVAGEMSGVK